MLLLLCQKFYFNIVVVNINNRYLGLPIAVLVLLI